MLKEISFKGLIVLGILSASCCVSTAMAQQEGQDGESGTSIFEDLLPPVHGFWEIRAGYRVTEDENEKDMSLMETRLQLDLLKYLEGADLKFKADFYGDLVTEEAQIDIREAYIFMMPADFMDLWVGRQILTWGTGDLIFINDMFPKDWQSFFIGRDSEYLKAPSDAVKASIFSDLANIDIVYTPQFDPDRYISGKRISYWNGNMGRIVGQNAISEPYIPNVWFRDDELAWRIYKNINNNELAFYGYRGYWKSPGGQTAAGRARFPKLNVYGASIRGDFAEGIANFEFGYYQSDEDEGGANPLINNSEIRLLGGYTREIAKNLTAGFQYYIEYMLDYDNYRANFPGNSINMRDEDRHLTTFRLTKTSEDQRWTYSLFTYYSPTDRDVYMRPNIKYKASDNIAWEVGGNIFFGDYNHTFFGQFEDNTNIYTAIRYSF